MLHLFFSSWIDSVIWGHISDEVSQASGQDVSILINEIRNSHSNRWFAIGMMKYVYSFYELPWVLKKHATDFLLLITEHSNLQEMNEDMICSFVTPGLISTLQVASCLVPTQFMHHLI